MMSKISIVVTTINHPTRAVRLIAEQSTRSAADFVIIGDEKSPPDFELAGARYFDLKSQSKLDFEYARIAPTRHYARKNIGYLIAIKDNPEIIVETDDDNVPTEDFWALRDSSLNSTVVRDAGWVNVYAFFTDRLIWPRGLPLDVIKSKTLDPAGNSRDQVYCPIQQGLADGDPDVDAVYRLLLELPVNFQKADPIILKDTWCPFNSQNTSWWRPAFPLLYLPYHCSFRMTDIWRSFVAQRISYLNGWGIMFHNATVFQERNEHNLLKDFEEEVPGYINNNRIRDLLLNLDLPAGVERIPEAMLKSYKCLVEAKIVGAGEIMLLDAWLNDMARM